MLRQNPIRRKRGEMNLKRRLATPPEREIPARPTAAPALLSFEQTPMPEKPEHEQKRDAYQLSQLFEMLLSAAQSPGLLALAESNLQRARQDGDELYAAVFEGVLAANRTPPDLAEAVCCYHRAFDLAEASDAPPDGFLHSMAWSLFAEHSVNFEVTELLRRARSESDAEGFDEQNAELIRGTAREFRGLPTFAPSFEKFQAEHEDRIRRAHRLVFREGKLSKKWPLLLFPRASQPFQDGFRGPIEESIFGNYFFYSNGIGTVVDPDMTFLDEFYRLGGSLEEIQKVIFTSNSKHVVATAVRQFCDVFERRSLERHEPAWPLFQVAPEIAQEIKREFQDFIDKGMIGWSSEWKEGLGYHLDGNSFCFQNGAIGLQTRAATGRWYNLHLLLPPNDGANPQLLVSSSCCVAIFAVRSLDDFYRAAAQARQGRPKLALFDFPKHFRLLEDPLREYLADIPWAPISDSLVCDWANGRFVDAVKAFDSPEDIGWSKFRDLSFGTVPGSETLCYFAKEMTDRFAEDGTDVMDFMQSAQRRRRGLYFT